MKTGPSYLCFFFSVVFLSSTLSFSAQQNSATRLQAVRVDKAPHLDGVLSEPAWVNAVPFSEFRMVEPIPGAEPSEKTDLKVLYDDSALYIAIYCYDSEPGKIAVNSLAHDQTGTSGGSWGMGHQSTSTSDDVVRVLIDPFLDKRTAYVFYVNPKGARSEGLVSGGSASLDWDGIWEARAKILPDGWSVEIKIPFKSISFKKELPAWGLNVERYIARKQETIRLSGISRDANFNNPMTAAELEGISDIKQGLGVTIRPYGLVTTQNERLGENKYIWDGQGGVDIYKNITPNLVAAFTYNTDFAETEVDERRINLTRFPLFFPEKRMFFLEGSDIFEFSSSVSFRPFFSRKIGLYQGQQVPINFGAKLYGKVGKFNLAMLDMETESFAELPKNNLFAGRLTYDFLSESKIGAIVTNGSPTGERNTLVGFDVNYASSQFAGNKNIWLAAWAVYNWNDKEGKHHGFGLRANYPNDLVNIETTYAYYGDALDPGLGFMMRPAIQTFYLQMSYNPRPAHGWLGKVIRQFFFQASGDFYWKLDGSLETSRLTFEPLSFRTESGERFNASLVVNRDVLPFDFEVAEGVVLLAGSYDFTNLRMSFNTASYRPLSFNLNYTVGQFYSGDYGDFSAGLTYHFRGNLDLSFNTNLVRGTLPEGKISENVYQLKLDFYFSPDLGFMNYVQYDSVSKMLGWSARFRWEVKPGNFIYLIYNSNWERRWDPTSRFYAAGDRGVFKITLSIRP
ncbi:MAG: carbohydrate binding family 9 domain-containing protein [Candidatus Saccharicenans sp.]|nr:carbohydrate binding family 9 domain-containing protein [Candidatus Saccharicenans sp.]